MNRRTFLISAGMLAASAILGGGKAHAEGKRILVAFFSATGTTRHVAEAIAAELKCDLYEIKPEKPYSYKFETLVLDMIHMQNSCLSYEVDRTKEFAPVKNPDGVDSVVSARELLQRNGVAL